MKELTEVAKLEGHRAGLSGMLRHVANELDAGALEANGVVIVLRKRERTRIANGVDEWSSVCEVFARGEGAEAPDDVIGLLERGKRQVAS